MSQPHRRLRPRLSRTVMLGAVTASLALAVPAVGIAAAGGVSSGTPSGAGHAHQGLVAGDRETPDGRHDREIADGRGEREASNDRGDREASNDRGDRGDRETSNDRTDRQAPSTRLAP